MGCILRMAAQAFRFIITNISAGVFMRVMAGYACKPSSACLVTATGGQSENRKPSGMLFGNRHCEHILGRSMADTAYRVDTVSIRLGKPFHWMFSPAVCQLGNVRRARTVAGFASHSHELRIRMKRVGWNCDSMAKYALPKVPMVAADFGGILNFRLLARRDEPLVPAR